MALLLAPAAGCVPPSEVVDEPIRIANPDDLDAEQLALEPGQSTLAEAERTMRERRLTGVARARQSIGDGPRLAALTADYQSRIHVFEDGVYRETVELATGGVLPYGYGLRFARDEGGVVLLAIYSDPLAWTARRAQAASPRVAVIARRGASFRQRGVTSLAELAGPRRAVSQPLFVGYDLRDGLLLVARDDRGHVLERASVVRSKGAALQLDLLPLAEAARCSCVDGYLRGESPTADRALERWR